MSNSEKMTLLVTGGAGFIGSNFVGIALARNYRVVVLDALTYAGHKENLASYEKHDGFFFEEANICDANKVKWILSEYNVDALLNFAAESHVDRSIDGPGEFIQTNVQGTCVLLTEALEYWKNLSGSKKENFRYLQVSTDEVFGELGKEGMFSESSPIEPNSPYSASKASADHFVRAWHHTFGLPTLTTHCSNNYGPFQFPEKLIPHMIVCALTGEKLPVYGKGENIRDWIHVEDHCRGILLALEKGTLGAKYCFGGRSERMNLDLVKNICQILDEKQPKQDGKSYAEQISFVTDRLGHDFRYAIDDRLAENELGFKQQESFESGLEKTISWYLENTNWCNEVLGKKVL